MKGQDNIFILSKGTASFIAEYVANKFNQITCIHAEAYGSAEFRHGPLAMINEDEKTAGKYKLKANCFFTAIFLVMDDENLEQVLANILQVKERGATCIVLTNLVDIYRLVKKEKIDFLIKLSPQKSILAPVLCTVPLLMICYYTALAKGINPDQNITTAININHDME